MNEVSGTLAQHLRPSEQALKASAALVCRTAMERTARLSQVPLASSLPSTQEAALTTAIRARALASMDYRADMLSRQQPGYLLRRASSGVEPLDTRRMMSYAPFAILPGALLCARRVPERFRVPFFATSLVGFAVLSSSMWGSREEVEQ